MKISKEVLIISRSEPKLGVNTDNRMIYLNPDTSISEWDECILMPPTLFSEICGTAENKKYVKVTCNTTHKSIYRLCRGEIAEEFSEDYVALTPASVRKLRAYSYHRKGSVEVKITKSWWLPFYWNHPFHATRISMRLGILSFILGILSLI